MARPPCVSRRASRTATSAWPSRTAARVFRPSSSHASSSASRGAPLRGPAEPTERASGSPSRAHMPMRRGASSFIRRPSRTALASSSCCPRPGRPPISKLSLVKHPRTADPYRDLDGIDANAPRFNQAVIGSLALVAFLTGWWPLLALLAAQLVLGLTLGRRWCLPCLAYFELVQPRVGEGPVEDSRPPRFANKIGVAFLGTASVLLALGYSTAGWMLGILVAALALFAAVTGICVGCQIYRAIARIRGVELCATCVTSAPLAEE